MKKIVVKVIFLPILFCSITAIAESLLYFPQTEDEWCKALDLNPECSGTSNEKDGIEEKGVQEKGLQMRSSIRIQFYPNSAKVAKYDSSLDKLGRQLRSATSNTNIIIEGHTDSIGSNGYNLRLSKKRAQVVRNYLINNYDIEPQFLQAIGRGENNPIASNESENGRSINRRVEFKRK